MQANVPIDFGITLRKNEYVALHKTIPHSHTLNTNQLSYAVVVLAYYTYKKYLQDGCLTILRLIVTSFHYFL